MTEEKNAIIRHYERLIEELKKRYITLRYSKEGGRWA
jgi:hypothetical protein